MSTIPVILISVASSIATLFIISCGLAIIFGLMRVVNMAHGEFMMIGALTTTALVLRCGFPLWLAILASSCVGAVAGALLEILLVRKIYQRQPLETLLVTFGVSLMMFQVAVDIVGVAPAGIPTPLGSLHVAGYAFPAYSVVLVGAAATILIGLLLIFRSTRYGLLARATAENPEMAQALGVAAHRINMLTFALGCSLSSLGGGLLAPFVSVGPSMGQAYVGQAFMTVVAGGPAFLFGTLWSAVLLGGVSSILAQIFTNLWGITSLFLVAVVLLRFKPLGLSGSWRRNV